jgi:hypothetical protein
LLTVVFLAAFLAGLLLGVRAMIVGVERPARTGTAPRAALTAPTVASAATTFGLAGYVLLRHVDAGAAASVAVAATLALLAALSTVALIAKWAVPSAAAEPPDPRFLLQGTPAFVTRALLETADGEVTYLAADGAQYATPARSFDGSALEVGTEVVIDRVEDGVAYVEAWAAVEKRL